MPKMVITWNTTDDPRPGSPCPICQPLNGHQWIFDTAKDQFPTILSIPNQEVWNLHSNEPRTHGDEPYHCRCYLTFTWNLDDVHNQLKTLRESVGRLYVTDE